MRVVRARSLIKKNNWTLRKTELYIQSLKPKNVKNVPHGTSQHEKPALPRVDKKGEAARASDSANLRLGTETPRGAIREATDPSESAEHGRHIKTLGPEVDLDREIMESLEEYRSLIKAGICIHIEDGFCQCWRYEKGCDPLQKILDKISGFYFDKERARSVYVIEDETNEEYVFLRPLAWICRRSAAYSPNPNLLPFARRSDHTLFPSPPPRHDVQAAGNDEAHTRDNEGAFEV